MKEILNTDFRSLFPRTWYWKSELCRIYGVDKKTFNKWILLFCGETINLEDYKRRRKIPQDLLCKLFQKLGGPNSGMEALRKNQIVNSAQSTYPVVRHFVYSFPEKCALTIEAYDRLSVLPPLVARQILNALE
jgi:hypothetical protein